MLGYLGVITLATVHPGVRSIQHKREPERLRTSFHTGLNGLSIGVGLAVGAFGIATGTWLLLALAPIGPAQGTHALRYARRPPASRMAHRYEHMAGMLTGGIAFHTAFAVFGVQRFVEYSPDGIVGILPWVLPAALGSIGIAVWTRIYRHRFGEA